GPARRQGRAVKLRAEWFGGLVSLEKPRAVVSVNRGMMKLLGLAESPRWQGADPKRLSAPTEVHVVISKRCSAGCTSCYVDATPQGAAMSLEQAREALERLAAHGVFHVAL